MTLVIGYFKKHYLIPTHESALAMVYEYAQSYGGINPGELLSSLSVWLEHAYTVELSDAPFITERIVQFGQHQAIKAAIGMGLDMLESHDDNLNKLRQIFDDALRVGSTRNMGTNFMAIAEMLPQLMLEDPVYGSKKKVPTGLIALDQTLFGGMGAGEVVVIAGPPGRGKSTLMINMAKKAANHFKLINSGKSVIYITLEGGLKELDIAVKFGASLTGIPINDIAAGVPIYYEKIQQQMNFLGPKSIMIKYFSPGTVGTEDLRWYVANAMSLEGIVPGLIVIDYADKLKGMELDSYKGAGQIYDSFTSIGDKFECPIVTGSQINRSWAEEEVIDGRGLADSWLKLANADIVITMCQTRDEHAAGIVRLYMAKVRKGEDSGTIYCHWNGASACIWEMTQSETIEYQQNRPVPKPSGPWKKDRH
jgi:replicative DNA helicase